MKAYSITSTALTAKAAIVAAEPEGATTSPAMISSVPQTVASRRGASM